MMILFMRYCVRSRLTAEGCRAAMVSISVRSSPPFRASGHFTVGGSWRWSPARMTRPAFWMAIQQEASRAWAASSMNRVGNFLPASTRLALPANVQAMTRASLNRLSLMAISSSVARSRRAATFGERLHGRRRAAGVQVADGFADGPKRGVRRMCFETPFVGERQHLVIHARRVADAQHSHTPVGQFLRNPVYGHVALGAYQYLAFAVERLVDGFHKGGWSCPFPEGRARSSRLWRVTLR